MHVEGNVSKERRGGGTIDVPVVESQRKGGDISRLDPLIGTSTHYPRPPVDRAETQDCALARVDDRRTGIDSEDPDIGDREGAT